MALKFLVATGTPADRSTDPAELFDDYDPSHEHRILRHLQDASRHSTHPGRAHVISLLDDFKTSGPNGTHPVLVLEITGPRLASIGKPMSADVVRDVCRQLVLSLDFLHQHGVAHGGTS